MNFYKFKKTDDLLGWDTQEIYVSDFTTQEVESLWEITNGRNLQERLQYIEQNAVLLGKTFKPLEITASFSMSW